MFSVLTLYLCSALICHYAKGQIIYLRNLSMKHHRRRRGASPPTAAIAYLAIAATLRHVATSFPQMASGGGIARAAPGRGAALNLQLMMLR